MDDKDWARLREIIREEIERALELDKPLGPWTARWGEIDMDLGKAAALPRS